MPEVSKLSRARSGDDGRGPLRRKITSRSEVGALQNELERTKNELDVLSRPLNENDVLSAAVNAVVAQGESLVTGGYKLADGRYELTFITPKGVDRSGQSPGTDQIVIEARSMVVDDAFVELSGLETMATNARNTLQHAEAWSGDDVFQTFKSASESEGVDMSSTPTVVSRPNEPFKVEVMDAEGKGYLLTGEADFLPDGSFAVKARAERRE
ncbi:hypothetical protein ACFQY0_05265 [Haloferula chungangensis]|uniref:Halobacterial output domain-containing protein n=1 Tax=Haloferula chungangensis TaxID=1048331 RepID=A0ABW2L4B2_9BACT